jgi:hypothetical protein
MLLMALTLIAINPPPRPMEVKVVRDAINDDVRTYAIQRDEGNRLVISCDPAKHDGPRVSFHSRRWLARGNMFTGERPIVYRFDMQAPRRMMWDIHHRHGTLDDSGRVASFVRDLWSAERLVFRTRDVENREFDITFRLRGVQPAINRVLAACTGGTR